MNIAVIRLGACACLCAVAGGIGGPIMMMLWVPHHGVRHARHGVLLLFEVWQLVLLAMVDAATWCRC